MELFSIAAYTVGATLVLYILVRIGSAAFFQSKSDYERKHNEQGQRTRKPGQ